MSSIDLWYATRATGLAAMVLMTATVVLGLTTARRAGNAKWPRFIQQDLHKRISLLTVVFLLVHILTSVLDSYVNIGWAAIVVPFTSAYDRFYVGLGAIALDLMIAVVISSLLRSHINAKVWRAIHWVSYVSWPVAMAHSIGTGTDMRLGWVDGLVGLCCLVVVSTATWRFAGSMITNRGRRVPDRMPTELALNGRTQ
jgi:methionine sulfoxide reductase heme-binding subunit